MPLNKKGKKIMKKMKEEYGNKKGESVFYAMENSGKLKGVKKAKKGMMTNLKPVPAETATIRMIITNKGIWIKPASLYFFSLSNCEKTPW